jgi:ABC-type branched-subunit amino acid transport system substrate-binding protein
VNTSGGRSRTNLIGFITIALMVSSCGLRAGVSTSASGTNSGSSGASGGLSPGADSSANGQNIDTGAAGSTGATGGATGSAAAGGTSASGGGATSGGGAAATGGGSGGGTSGGATGGGGGGGGGGAVAGGIAISGPDSQGVSSNRIKIGILAPISGAAGFLGANEVDATNAYFDLANSRGGVRGHTYQTVVLDTQFDPSVEATDARQLIDQQKVFALFSVFGDSEGPYVASKGIPEVVAGFTPPAFSSKYPTTYPMAFSAIEGVADMAYYLTQVKKLPIHSTAVLYDTQNAPIGPWVPFLAKAWQIWGVNVKSTDPFNLSDADCTQLTLKVKGEGIDFWQLAQSLGWPICQQAMARQNWTPPFGRGGPYTADTHFVGQVGPAAEGIYAEDTGVQIAINTGQPYPADPSGKAPKVDDFINSMKKYSPNSGDIGSLENVWSQSFWSGAELIDQAIHAQTQAITWKGVNQWIQGQTHWVSGLTQPQNFTPTCKSGAQMWMFQWKNNGGTLVQPDWHQYGGVVNLPDSVKNQIVPGGGACWLTKAADAGL